MSGPCQGRIKSIYSPNKGTFIWSRYGLDTEQTRSRIPCEADFDTEKGTIDSMDGFSRKQVVKAIKSILFTVVDAW